MLTTRFTLPAAALKFFNLAADPFDIDRVPEADEMFTDVSLDALAARLREAVFSKRFVAVSGEVGAGKTTLKIRIARELAASPHRVHLIHPEFFDMNQITVGSIASYILEEFGVKVPRSPASRVRAIRRHLSTLAHENRHIALVFDECHRLSDKVLISLKNFWEMTGDPATLDTTSGIRHLSADDSHVKDYDSNSNGHLNGSPSRLLGILLFGQPHFAGVTLRDIQFREIAERVQLLELPPLTRAHARHYLAHRLALTGGHLDQLFEPAAVNRLCAHAQTPLALGNLAAQALATAYRLEEPQVLASMLNLPNEPTIRHTRQPSRELKIKN